MPEPRLTTEQLDALYDGGGQYFPQLRSLIEEVREARAAGLTRTPTTPLEPVDDTFLKRAE
jgi:hypothetical protein